MSFEEATQIVLSYLREHKKAKNSVLLSLIGNDTELFESVKEELIFEDLAQDKNGVGLLYIEEEKETLPQKKQSKPEQPAVPKRLHATSMFISYGRVDAAALAQKLQADLQEEGFEIWLDQSSIEKGARFEVFIEKGIKSSEVVLALMSEHSLREESVCRDEVVFALNENKLILPIKVQANIVPSLLLARRNWIDFSEDYASAYQQLTEFFKGNEAALKKPKLNQIGGIAPFDFSNEIAFFLTDFTGRQWLLTEIEKWLSDEDNRAFVIVGEPGIGKSAISAWLTKVLDEKVVGVHFCTKKNTRTLNPFEFVAALTGQLSELIEGYTGAIEDKKPNVKRNSASDAFRELIVEPLKLLPPQKTAVIIVDSLDEANTIDGETITEVIARQANDLPSWIKIICTTRPEEGVLKRIKVLDSFVLNAEKDENKNDVNAYIDAKFTTLPVLKEFEETVKQHLFTHIKKISAGNFLYAKMLFENLKTGKLSPANIEKMTGGLAEYYYEAFKRTFPDANDYRSKTLKVLRPLVAAETSIKIQLLATISGLDRESLLFELKKLNTYLKVSDNAYIFYHKSIRDWLVDEDHSEEYQVNASYCHAAIANALFDNFEVFSEDDYVIHHLFFHLLQSDQLQKATELILKPIYWHLKIQHGLLNALLQELNSLLKNLPEHDKRYFCISELRHILLCQFEYIKSNADNALELISNACHLLFGEHCSILFSQLKADQTDVLKNFIESWYTIEENKPKVKQLSYARKPSFIKHKLLSATFGEPQLFKNQFVYTQKNNKVFFPVETTLYCYDFESNNLCADNIHLVDDMYGFCSSGSEEHLLIAEEEADKSSYIYSIKSGIKEKLTDYSTLIKQREEELTMPFTVNALFYNDKNNTSFHLTSYGIYINGELYKALKDEAFYSYAYHENNKQDILLFTSNKNTYLFDADQHKLNAFYPLENALSTAINHTGKLCAFAQKDAIKVVDMRTKEQVALFNELYDETRLWYSGTPANLQFHPKLPFLLTNTGLIYNYDTEELVMKLEDKGTCSSFSKDGLQLLTAGDKGLMFWNMAGKERYAYALKQLHVDYKHTTVFYFSAQSRKILLFDSNTNQFKAEIELKGPNPKNTFYNNAASLLYIIDTKNYIRILSTSGYREVSSFGALHESTVYCFQNDYTNIIYYDTDNALLKYYNLLEDKLVHCINLINFDKELQKGVSITAVEQGCPGILFISCKLPYRTKVLVYSLLGNELLKLEDYKPAFITPDNTIVREGFSNVLYVNEERIDLPEETEKSNEKYRYVYGDEFFVAYIKSILILLQYREPKQMVKLHKAEDNSQHIVQVKLSSEGFLIALHLTHAIKVINSETYNEIGEVQCKDNTTPCSVQFSKGGKYLVLFYQGVVEAYDIYNNALINAEAVLQELQNNFEYYITDSNLFCIYKKYLDAIELNAEKIVWFSNSLHLEKAPLFLMVKNSKNKMIAEIPLPYHGLESVRVFNENKTVEVVSTTKEKVYYAI